jgi:hypothetical protein
MGRLLLPALALIGQTVFSAASGKLLVASCHLSSRLCMCLYLLLPSYCIPSLVGLQRELSLILAASAGNGAMVWSPERRVARVQRETKETSVAVELNLDGTGHADNQSGIHFLDHMLDVSTHPHHGQWDAGVGAAGLDQSRG